jgi:4,5-dihydroxyphthalate decarboxylase
MTQLSITLACSENDRTRPVITGTVPVEGVNLNCITLPPEEMFFRMVRYQEFDVSELSLAAYALMLRDNCPFVAIPVFPARAFRHGAIYVNESANISDAADLVGKTVGLAEYQVAANVWIRGILSDHYGVPNESVRYRTGGLHQPGRTEKVALENLPKEIDIAPVPPGQTLSDMLANGELDALYSPRVPNSFQSGDRRVRRLFEDSKGVEEDYFKSTGIFPIMHLIVIRRDLYHAHRWIAQSLSKAFGKSLEMAAAALDEATSLPTLLPWAGEELSRVRSLMGDPFWTYGLDAKNELVLETFLRYSEEQGLTRGITAAELFAPETLSTARV